MIRDSVRQGMAQYREAIIFAAIVAVLVWLLIEGRFAGSFYVGVLVVLLTAAGIGFFNALGRGRLRGAAPAEGIVLIDEGRIGHFGPDTGGFVDLDQLTSVVLTGPVAARVWVLRHAGGPDMRIPTGARDADQLVDYLAGLGVTPLQLRAAVSTGDTVKVWARPGG